MKVAWRARVAAPATRVPVTIPLAARVYAWSVVAAALLGLAAAAYARPAVSNKAGLLAGLLTAGTAVAMRFPVQFAPKIKVYVTNVPIFAAVLLLPLPVAAAVAAVGIASGEALKGDPLLPQAFN